MINAFGKEQLADCEKFEKKRHRNPNRIAMLLVVF